MSEFFQTLFTIDDIRQAFVNPLPGMAGQVKMAPLPQRGKVNRWELPESCRDASVLLLLYPYQGFNNETELHIVLIRRPEYPGVHSGQISFPGGRWEEGESLQTTALRETVEEIGVPPDRLEILGQLTTLYTPPSNFCIYPFVAFSADRPIFRPDAIEVAELIEAPLSLFSNPVSQKQEIWNFEQYGERQVPFFDIFGHKVWGATAMIMSEFLALLAEA